MKISEIITDKYKLRMPPTVYYELLADVQEMEEDQEPTTKNDSSELEKNSKKLEKGTTKNDLGVDCISRQSVLDKIQRLIDAEQNNIDENGDYMNYARERVNAYEAIQFFVENDCLCPSVTPQLSVPEVTALAEWTEKLTKASEDAYNKGFKDGIKGSIPKADYENRLKADLKAILVELQLKIEELDVSDVVPEYQDGAEETKEYIANMIEEKINSLKEVKDGKNND